MVWEKRVRLIAWAFFFLMWIPLGVMFYTAVTDGDEGTIGIPLGLFFILCILFAILLFGSFAVAHFEKETIKKKGIPAKATIVSVSETGTEITDQPLMRIELEVQPPYDTRFRTTVEYILPYSSHPLVQAGKTVQVYYHEETKEVALADL